MREKTLKAVGASAAFLTGSFLAVNTPDILTSVLPAVIGGYCGARFPEWDNIGSEFSGGPSGKSPALRLGNILHGGNPVLADTRKKYLTDEERALASQTVGGLRFETRSILAFALALLPLFGLWMLFGAIKPISGMPRDIMFALMVGFGTGYAVNILLTIISYGTFSRNGAKLLWPILPIRFRLPLIHSEELLPDGGNTKDRRGNAERFFAISVTAILTVLGTVLIIARTDILTTIMNLF